MSQLERVFGKFKTSKGSGAEGIANYFLKIYPLLLNHFVTFLTFQSQLVYSQIAGKLQEWPLFLKVVNQMIVLITDRSQCCRFCPGFSKS